MTPAAAVPAAARPLWPERALATSWKGRPRRWCWPRSASCCCGVVARFGFNRPIVWTDELASILFLWLAMLGSVIALQRREHMRLTAVVAALPPAWQARAQALAVGAAGLFLALMLPHAADYAQDEWYIETPALGWSNMIRAGAIPVGMRADAGVVCAAARCGTGWPTWSSSRRCWACSPRRSVSAAPR